jgi:tRNA(adenine34) deaminase
MLLREEDEHWMGLALAQARLAYEAEEVPVGCVIVLENRVIGRGYNRTESAQDPTAHAEILAISAAASTVGATRLVGAKVYVTVEPCVMCAGALLLARVSEVIFGAYEPKFGALGSRLRLQDVAGFNHSYEIRASVRAEECAALVREFFRARRRAGEVEAQPEGEELS